MKTRTATKIARAFDPIRSRALTLLVAALLLASVAGCKDKDRKIEVGESQGATAQEKELQNRNLVEAVVYGAENQEKYPDLAYLRGALGRLGSWLSSQDLDAVFDPDPEYDELAKKFAALIETVRKDEELVRLFNDPNGKPTEKDCDELLANIKSARDQLRDLADELCSTTLVIYSGYADELAKNLEGAREFQFADPVEAYQERIRKASSEPVAEYYNFAKLRVGLVDFSRLLVLDGKTYLPQDADYLRSVVWRRDVFNWVKGSRQNDMEIIQRLFDWSVKNVVLNAPPVGPAGPIAPLDWQILLTSRGTAMDRAIMFIELLRQHRLDAFVLRPAGKTQEELNQFPIVVGVRLEGQTHLFAPGLALPFVSKDQDAIAFGKEDAKNEYSRGLIFNKIATLAEVAADDSILRRFDLDGAPFNAKADDFKDMVAYVPSTPFQVAARMAPLEEEFSGKISTVLSTPFEEQKARILELDGISDVKKLHEATAPILEQSIFPEEGEMLTEIYMTPIATGASLEVSAASDRNSKTDESIAGYVETREFSGEASGARKAGVAPLWVGKIAYLRGHFVTDRGAATWFLQGRTSERTLKAWQKNVAAGVNKAVQEYAQFREAQGQAASEDELREFALLKRQELEFDIEVRKQIKIITSYYLALLSDADGNEGAAMDRLGDDSLRWAKREQEQPGDDFKRAANYLRARILENKGSYNAAVERLRDENDPAARARAKWIAELAGLATEEPKPAEQPAADEEAPAQEPAAEAPTEENAAPEAAEPAQEEPAAETQETEPATETPAEEPAQTEPGTDAPAESAQTEAPAEPQATEPAPETPAEQPAE